MLPDPPTGYGDLRRPCWGHRVPHARLVSLACRAQAAAADGGPRGPGRTDYEGPSGRKSWAAPTPARHPMPPPGSSGLRTWSVPLAGRAACRLVSMGFAATLHGTAP